MLTTENRQKRKGIRSRNGERKTDFQRKEERRKEDGEQVTFQTWKNSVAGSIR